MKKLLHIVGVLLCLSCLILTALAAEQYANIYELYEHWSHTQMPEWVCSVSSTDGNADRLTVVVNSHAAEDELRSQLQDESTLTVHVSENGYSDRQLMEIQEEIVNAYMNGQEGPIVSVGVGWAVIDGEVTGFGESGTESRVVVSVLTAHFDEYREILHDAYGDMVYVEASGGIATTMEETATLTPVHYRNPLYLWLFVILLLLATAMLLIKGKAVAQTIHGHTVSSVPPTAAQVEAAITECTTTPDEHLHTRILDEINTKEK